jgi:hypothetical protein
MYYLDGLRKTTNILNQDIRFAGRDLNPEPPEYEEGVLTSHVNFKFAIITL